MPCLGAWSGDISTVSSVPVTSRVVAVRVTVLVSYPARRTAFSTVGYWPGQIDLHNRGRELRLEVSARRTAFSTVGYWPGQIDLLTF